MTKEYTNDDILVLDDIQHVRLRTAVYLGNMNEVTMSVPSFVNNEFKVTEMTFVPAALRAVCEIIDNSVDEFTNAKTPKALLSVTFDPNLNKITVADNGRGVPITRHATGPYTPEVVFGSLRSGRNFTGGKEAGVRGMNGVGSSVTNFTSKLFEIDVIRDGKKYRQEFRDGSNMRGEPVITSTASKKTGTQIGFILDEAVYKNEKIPEHLLISILQGVALCNPTVTVEYTNVATGAKHKFAYPKGFEDIIKKIADSHYVFREGDLEFYVVPGAHTGIDEQVYTWVNSGLLLDGGLCNTQFVNAFCDAAVEACAPLAKKQKCEVTKNDVRRGLLVIGNIKVSDPEFDSQAKTRLTGPNMRNELKQLVANGWSGFARKNKAWIESVVEYAAFRHHGQRAKDTEKEIAKKSNKPVPGLLDAVNSRRSQTTVIVTEGLSAASMIENVRDASKIGSFPLTGKMNNVWGCKPGEVLAMPKLTNLLAAVKLIPGKKAIRSELHFGTMDIASDADPDGDAIFTSVVCLLYNFWPELFDPNLPPFVYRLVAPNVCVVKGSKRIHFARRADYEAVKDKYKGWQVNYYKGLGSMEDEDWKMVLENPDCRIPIVEDGSLKATMELLFGNDTEPRKIWLQGSEGEQDE